MYVSFIGDARGRPCAETPHMHHRSKTSDTPGNPFQRIPFVSAIVMTDLKNIYINALNKIKH